MCIACIPPSCLCSCCSSNKTSLGEDSRQTTSTRKGSKRSPPSPYSGVKFGDGSDAARDGENMMKILMKTSSLSNVAPLTPPPPPDAFDPRLVHPCIGQKDENASLTSGLWEILADGRTFSPSLMRIVSRLKLRGKPFSHTLNTRVQG